MMRCALALDYRDHRLQTVECMLTEPRIQPQELPTDEANDYLDEASLDEANVLFVISVCGQNHQNPVPVAPPSTASVLATTLCMSVQEIGLPVLLRMLQLDVGNLCDGQKAAKAQPQHPPSGKCCRPDMRELDWVNHSS